MVLLLGNLREIIFIVYLRWFFRILGYLMVLLRKILFIIRKMLVIKK